MLNTTKLATLYRRVMEEGKNPRRQADLVYLFGQTRKNESSVLDVAKSFEGTIGTVGEDGTEEGSGFPGFSHWRSELIRRGIPAERIIGTKGTFSRTHTGGKFRGNTLTEAFAVVRLAKREGYESAITVLKYLDER